MTYTTPRAGSESLNLHNEFAPDSIEAKDLRTLLHPSTNLKQHSQQGPVVHERADGASRRATVHAPAVGRARVARVCGVCSRRAHGRAWACSDSLASASHKQVLRVVMLARRHAHPSR